MMPQPFQTYQRMAVSTADPLRIVMLLYEGAIKNLNQAATLLDRDAETASARISRTLEILNYLRSVLDHEKGGEIAFNLERLYEYMRDTLAQANIQKDEGRLREVVGLLQTLLEGWRGIRQSSAQTEIDDTPHGAPPAQAAKRISTVVG
jgi:flagellar protein FliS